LLRQTLGIGSRLYGRPRALSMGRAERAAGENLTGAGDGFRSSEAMAWVR
jgi:hypothetical protein